MHRVRLLILTITIIALSALAFVAGTAAQTSDYVGQKWEYITLSVNVNSDTGGYNFTAFSDTKDKSEAVNATLDPFEQMIIEITLGDRTTKFPDAKALVSAMNTLGADGWELISAPTAAQSDYLLLFRRPVQ